MIGITKISHSILYIAGTVKKPPAISDEYYYLFFTVNHHFCISVPGTQHPARRHAASTHTPTMQSQKDLPVLEDSPKGSKRALAGCPRQPVAIRWEDGLCSPAIAAGGCPIPHLLVLPAGVAMLRSPGIPHRLSSPASPHPIVTLPFLAEITHLWCFPCTLFSSGNAAKQALLSWHLQEYTSVHRNIFAVSNPKYSSRRSYRNSAVGKCGASELHIFYFQDFRMML